MLFREIRRQQHRPGRDRIHLNSGAQRFCQRFCQAYDARLGNAIREIVGVRSDGCPVSKGDDLAVDLPCFHVAADFQCEQERPLQVRVDVEIPVALSQGVERSLLVHRGTGHEDVDVAEMFYGLGNRRTYFLRVRLVCADRDGVHAQRLDLPNRAPCFGHRRVVMHHDVRPAPREAEGDLAPDPLGGASDKGCFAFQFHRANTLAKPRDNARERN